MNLDTLLSSNAVINTSDIKSKKRALEVLAETLAKQPAETLDALDIFQLLIEREKLGSTGIGHGVALPHARTKLTDHAIGAFLKLNDGIDFDSPDNIKTDLIFALLVPEHYTDEHLKILAYLATLFSDETFCKEIRDTNDMADIHKHLLNWQITSQAS
jgi:PTS system nitrogen regulatory IIA component